MHKFGMFALVPFLLACGGGSDSRTLGGNGFGEPPLSDGSSAALPDAVDDSASGDGAADTSSGPGALRGVTPAPSFGGPQLIRADGYSVYLPGFSAARVCAGKLCVTGRF